MLKCPLVPAVADCATKVAGLSTSVMVNVPPVVSGALVSSKATTALERIAASLVPLIVTCTLVVVPSALATVKVSETDWPTFRLSKTEFAV